MNGLYRKPLVVGLRSATILIAILLCVACSSDLEKAEDAYLASCQAAGGTESACVCTFSALQGKYGDEVVVRLVEGETPPDFMQTMQDAANQCRFK